MNIYQVCYSTRTHSTYDTVEAQDEAQAIAKVQERQPVVNDPDVYLLSAAVEDFEGYMVISEDVTEASEMAIPIYVVKHDGVDGCDFCGMPATYEVDAVAVLGEAGFNSVYCTPCLSRTVKDTDTGDRWFAPTNRR